MLARYFKIFLCFSGEDLKPKPNEIKTILDENKSSHDNISDLLQDLTLCENKRTCICSDDKMLNHFNLINQYFLIKL